MSKISIIGAAGTLGSSCAMTISLEGYADELCLIDVNENFLDNHLMDLENAFPDKNIYRGTYEDLKGSSIIVITAGVPNRNEETSREAYLMDNINIFNKIGSNIARYASDAIIVTASNPVDLLNYYLYKKMGFQKNQLIGYTLNDSYRFGWAINKTLNTNKDVYSPVIGEHGDTQVPVFSKVKRNDERIEFTTEQKSQIYQEIKTWFVRFNSLNIPRTTGWTTGVGIRKIIDALSQKEGTVMTASTVLDGEYGAKEISIGVPVVINQDGIQRIMEWDLVADEQKAFDKSVQKLKKIVQEHPTTF
ncbi:malate dehydrogenase [Lentibacillus salinarum]|uniref:Malate dehydrogenase n=1 Tax=Lentibacillus salinarum TaxID=446820 RepID=A0ABW3ZRH6_9BACI